MSQESTTLTLSSFSFSGLERVSAAAVLRWVAGRLLLQRPTGWMMKILVVGTMGHCCPLVMACWHPCAWKEIGKKRIMPNWEIDIKKIPINHELYQVEVNGRLLTIFHWRYLHSTQVDLCTYTSMHEGNFTGTYKSKCVPSGLSLLLLKITLFWHTSNFTS